MRESNDVTDQLARKIVENGPISIAAFMAEANKAYYAARDPLGVEGDFITAPEISQMFGEMLGIWCADLWLRAGKPETHYVELGPGRGTLASDALRAASVYGWHPQVHFVETSPALIEKLLARFPEANIHDDIESLPTEGALLILANEFFDALPAHQYQCTTDGWRERLVDWDEGRGFFPMVAEGDALPFLPLALRDAPDGAMCEAGHAAAGLLTRLSARIRGQGGAMLVIDYGHAHRGHGETLQAVSGHKAADPFDNVGNQDLTVHVDFTALETAAVACGLRAAPAVTQGAFLGQLGIGPRARILAEQNPAESENVKAALVRLTSPEQMGELFKAAAYYSADWPDPAGF